MTESPEPGALRVAAAAIRDIDGEVFTVPPPGRHHDVIRMMFEKGRECPSLDCQGFVLSDGRFASRKAAKVVAEASGQLLPRASRLRELFSEDVW
ncbi:MAG: hypothetical protein EPN91_06590 [Salinibacterium sp.]|nr:MAG: hypothetical protein EPN91_06590 [Salinibacterium sp.]